MSLNNGAIWNVMAQEFEIWLDGEFITWASTSDAANKIYNEALKTKYEHLKKNTDEAAWEWFTLTRPKEEETIKALNKAMEVTE